MLAIDARDDPPTHAITLTTRDPDTTGKAYRAASFALWRKLRRDFGRVEYWARIEFTTGRGEKSGGRRRMHGHHLVKFRDERPDVLDLGLVTRETWRQALKRQAESFEAYVIDAAELVVPGAAIHYVGLHHAKASQLPPDEWTGRVERYSRGYFASAPAPELRERARVELRGEAIAWATGLSADDSAALAEMGATWVPAPEPGAYAS